MAELNLFDLHPFFDDVQLRRVFPDGKTLVDCVPRKGLAEINTEYEEQKSKSGFDLVKFVSERFDLPVVPVTDFVSDVNETVETHIDHLWEVLTRAPDKASSSLIPLPYPYVVPGGRFGEIYYWDSYFTMLGLRASGRVDMVENMVKNFSYLIDTIGYIPNGNRTYYVGRSQPPFYSLMVELLAEIKGEQVIGDYLPQLQKEYEFWMRDSEILDEKKKESRQVVRLPNGEVLNRYWDEYDTPRPEAYREDIELAHLSKKDASTVFRHLRAGAASGWDYTQRWFREPQVFGTIHCADIIPVDLNCLLYNLERLIAKGFTLGRFGKKAEEYQRLADERKASIEKYCWNDSVECFCDYDTETNKQSTVLTLAALYPLFIGIASQAQADAVAKRMQAEFLKAGGLVTTLVNTGQQWDSPNGWAPLQWIGIQGLSSYGHNKLAGEIARRWINLNRQVFQRTGKLMEKYNVVDTKLEAGGGEYPGQDGFGWTNGVLLALIKQFAQS